MAGFGDIVNLNRMKALTGAYYGVDQDEDLRRKAEGDAQSEAEKQANANNLDSSYFQVDTAASEIALKTPHLQLLDMENDLRTTIVQLDNQMQLLVYENYRKFIGATDTMQKMKEKLIKMESQVSGLESRMEAIANGTRRMNNRGATKREEVARLDRLGGLVNKLSALFELPKKLRMVTDVQEIRQLILMFKAAMPYLQKHSQIPSFARIERDAKDATIEIKGRLKMRIQDEHDMLNAEPPEVDAMVGILLDLGESPASLANIYFNWHKDHILRTAVSKEDAVKESFETCVFLLKTTMFEPLNQVLITGEEFFPEESLIESVASLKLVVAKEIMRSLIDKLRSRFDAEAVNFLSKREASSVERDDEEEEATKGEEDEDQVDRIVRALALVMREFQSWDRALPSQVIARELGLIDRAQELAERVIRKQVNAMMSELRTRTELHVEGLTKGGDLKQILEKTIKSVADDAAATRNHFARLLKKATVIMASAGEMAGSFDDLFKFQMRDWTEFLALQLRKPSVPSSSTALLVKALLAKELAARAKDLGVPDIKHSMKILAQASEDALKAFCSEQGVLAASQMNSYDDGRPDSRPRRVGDGVVFMLNHVVSVGRLTKQVGIPSRKNIAAPVASATGVAPAGATYSRGVSSSNAAAVSMSKITGGGQGLSSQILKMFSEKLVVFDKVEMDGPSIAGATLRVALKTWFEHIREEILNRYEFQQIQLDANFVRTFVPLLTGDSAPGVNKLVAEVVASARERCVDPSTMDAVALDTLCNERKDDVKLRG